ncbi:hypothetical protein N7505_007829 [Penicillium chrysogenum]|uniref:Uncharacterized protein n=1 Tax=Penicillium chrysogenum TaxID=5076 RepID=A0ABQ8WEL7_PENCH|nr:hypothetical protein N7505_007829 [Penicillium chrysogenum]
MKEYLSIQDIEAANEETVTHTLDNLDPNSENEGDYQANEVYPPGMVVHERLLHSHHSRLPKFEDQELP